MPAWRHWWLAVRGSLEVGATLALLAVLHRTGWAVPGNIWFFGLYFLVGSVLLFALTAATGSVGAGQVGVALNVVFTGSLMYLTGWGPVMVFSFVLLATYLGDLGRSWRTLLTLSLITVAAGQAATAAGWLPTYLAPGAAQVVGAVSMLSTALTLRALGQAENARNDADRALAASEERFRTVLEDSQDVTVITDEAGRPFFVSKAVEHVMGWTAEEYAENLTELVHPEDVDVALTLTAALRAGARSQSAEMRMRYADGTWHWHKVSVRNLIDHPAVAGWVFHHRDVTLRRRHEERLAYAASHDALTGLANRAALHDALETWASGAGAVLYLDLDGFKQVNDEQGHAAGDELLVRTAAALRDCASPGDLVARLGGDEFVLLLRGVTRPEEAAARAERILGRAEVGASIGIALCDPARQEPVEALRRADAAMYEAKRDGRHGWRLADQEVTSPRVGAARR